MSAWPRPTTADIGLRAFAPSMVRLFDEVTIGMQNILISDESAGTSDELIRHNAQWNVSIPSGNQDYEMLLVHWLEEVLYRAEVHRQWCIACNIMAMQPKSGTVLYLCTCAMGQFRPNLNIQPI